MPVWLSTPYIMISFSYFPLSEERHKLCCYIVCHCLQPCRFYGCYWSLRLCLFCWNCCCLAVIKQSEPTRSDIKGWRCSTEGYKPYNVMEHPLECLRPGDNHTHVDYSSADTFHCHHNFVLLLVSSSGWPASSFLSGIFSFFNAHPCSSLCMRKRQISKSWILS